MANLEPTQEQLRARLAGIGEAEQQKLADQNPENFNVLADAAGFTKSDSITSSSLMSTSTPNFESPRINSPSSISGLSADIPKVELTKEETQADDLTQRLLDINNKLAGRTTFKKEQERTFGVPEAQQSMDDLGVRLRDLERREAGIRTEYEGALAAGKGTLAPFVSGERDARLRQNAIEALTVSSLIDAASNRLTSAQRKVDRAVEEKYGPLLEEQDIKLKNLDILIKSPALSRAEKDRAEARKLIEENRKAELQKQKDEQSEVWKVGVDAAKGGADSVTLEKIRSAKTKEEALGYAATFLQKEDVSATVGSLQEFKLIHGRMPKDLTELNTFTESRKVADKTPGGIKPATQAQQTVAGYAVRVEQAEPTLKSLENSISSMNILSFEAQRRAPATFQTAKIQQYMQAARNFINAVLRRESGAVISPSEFSEARQQYLPTPGDTSETLKQKELNRKIVFENFKRASGTAFVSVDELLSGISPTTEETEVYVTPDGTEYVKGEDGLYYPK